MKNLTNMSPEAVLQSYRHDYLGILKEIGKEFDLPKGAQLRAQDLYFLVDGLCTLCMEGEIGRDISIIYFYPGRLLNFLPSLGHYYYFLPRNNSPSKRAPIPYFFVRAIKDCRFLRIDHTKFLDIYFQSLPLHSLIVQSLANNCIDIFLHLFSLHELPASQRIASNLLGVMNDFPPHYLKRHITYNELATHLSIHPVTVAKIFRALQYAEIIDRDGSAIMVRDPERLRRIALGREKLFYKRKKSENSDK